MATVGSVVSLGPGAGGGGPGSYFDHGLLSGLLHDDHTQYLLIDGSRAMTGALNINTNIDAGSGSQTYNASAGNNASASWSVKADGASIYMAAHSTTKTGTYGGFPLADMVGIFSSSVDRPSSFIIGTKAADPLHFITGNAHVMTLTAGQRVGILNLAPAEALDVTGNIAVSGNVDGVNVSSHAHTGGAGGVQVDHGGLGGLGDDDHTSYFRKSVGRAGGQTLVGGTAASENLTLSTTSNATKGKVLVGTSAYDEVNNRLGVGTNAPAVTLDVNGGTLTQRVVEPIAGNDTLLAAESFKIVTNEGAAAQSEYTLPSAAAGLQFEFILQDADGAKISAAAGDTIRKEGDVTAAAGYIRTATIGACIRLVAINDTEWVAASFTPTAVWTVDS